MLKGVVFAARATRAAMVQFTGDVTMWHRVLMAVSIFSLSRLYRRGSFFVRNRLGRIDREKVACRNSKGGPRCTYFCMNLWSYLWFTACTYCIRLTINLARLAQNHLGQSWKHRDNERYLVNSNVFLRVHKIHAIVIVYAYTCVRMRETRQRVFTWKYRVIYYAGFRL